VSFALSAYRAATGLLEPLAGGVLRARASKGKEDAARLGERLGRADRPRPEGPLVWLHGVSVGESLSLLPLVDALRTRRPRLNVLVTSGTVTSAELLAQRLPEGVIHQFAPVDAPGAARRFLAHWRPDLAVFVESELWPNLLSQARLRGVRLALVSARITEASAASWARAPGAARELLDAFDLVLPQDPASAERFERLGAKTGPQLNLKLVGGAPPTDSVALARFRELIGDRSVIAAVSTHPGEEPLIAAAFVEAAAGRRPLLIVAPRHPDRGVGVAEALQSSGLRTARRAAGEPLKGETDVYIADTLGELGLLLSVASVAVMGGSFVEGIGGHNPLEPARMGVAVVTGPHHFNAAAIYAEMFERVAAIEARDEAELGRHLTGLLDYPHIARRIGEAGLTYAEAQGAALDQAMALLEPLLPT